MRTHLPVAALLALSCTAGAQEYPARAIHFVVATTPGASADLAARVVAPEMSRILGQPIVVENKPGAGQITGLEYIARQMPADGYNVGVFTVDGLAILPLTVKNLRFDPLRDATPVIGLVEGRLVFGTSSSLPWKTFEELVAHAKANPGKLNYGSSAPTVRLPMIALAHGLGLDVVYVPYSSGAPYIQALAAGEVQMGFIGDASATGLGPKFRALAITGDERKPALGAVPTFGELGFPQIRGSSHSLSVRAGTPRYAIDKLHAAASSVLQSAQVKAQFAKMQQDIVNDTPELAAKRLADVARNFAELARRAGIRPE